MPLTLDPAALSAALSVPVQVAAGERGAPALRFRQAVAAGAALFRQGHLDLGTGCFRSTLWAGPHRCLDHLELTAIQAVHCDPVAGRLLLHSPAGLLALTRQGTLSLVPATIEPARYRRRRRDAPPPATGDRATPAAGPVHLDSAGTPPI